MTDEAHGGPTPPTEEASGPRPEGGSPRREEASDRTAVLAPARAPTAGESPGLLLVSAPTAAPVGTYHRVDGEVVIGRSARADIRVDDPGVSREHVKLVRGPDGEVVAVDLGSTNGTWVNGTGIRSAVLSEGDRLQIGTATAFLFGADGGGAEAEILLRQAVAAAGAGTWEWFPATGVLRLYGAVSQAVEDPPEPTAPCAEASWARVHAADRAPLRERLEEAVQTGRAVEAEVRLVQQDGRVLTVTLTGEPFRDPSGRAVRLAGHLLDVTERRRAEAELRRHALLFDSLADAVVIVGLGGTILDWSASAERLLGWSRAEALGRRPGALLVGGDPHRLEGALVACAREGGRHAEELTLRGKAGAELPVELVAVPLVGREEEPVGCVVVIRDLGERRRLQAQLQVAERLASLGTLAAGVAHEINNPLAFVISNLDFVGRQLAARAAGTAGLPELLEALGDVRKGADRIATIVRDLQAFCGRERPGTTPGESDPNAALEFALRVASSGLRDRARLIRDLQPVPRVYGTEARLGQVFLNLIVNATQATAPGASEAIVRVASRFDPAAHRVVIEVADQGTGIPPDVLPHIFEPFFTTKPVGVGNGLGLFVCHGIVAELGGELAVESALGRGTTFRVLLPAAGPAPAPAPVRRRVLLVDDEPLLGAALRRSLGDRYDVVAACDPHEALERVRVGERFDFALIDMQMPGLSGPALLARIQELDPGLARRSAMITGGSLEEASERLGEGQRPPVLPKPIDLDRLVALVEASARDEDRP